MCSIPPSESPMSLNWLGDSKFEKLKVRKGDIIHGILWISTNKTREIMDGKPYPMFLYHKLKVHDVKELTGNAQQVLCATLANCHESGSVSINDAVNDFRKDGDKAVFIKYDESIVLDFFYQFTEDPYKYGQRMESVPVLAMPDFMA